MTKSHMTRNEMFKDLLISQLENLRLRLVQNICDIDKYVKEIEKRFENNTNKKEVTNG